MEREYGDSACGIALRVTGAITFTVWLLSLAFVVFALAVGEPTCGQFIYIAPFAAISGLFWYGLARLLGAVGAGAQDSLTKRSMREAAIEAISLRDQLLDSHKSAPFSLYLRAFRFDKVTIRNPLKSHLPFLPSFYHPLKVPWESAFIRAVAPLGRVVSLGYPSEYVAADRLTVPDEEWVDTFVLLASFADHIFVWPSTQSGALWELDWLRKEDALSRCIFVVPRPHELGGSYAPEHWDSVHAALSRLGVYTVIPEGAIFTISGGNVSTEPLDVVQPRRLRRSLKRLLATIRSGPEIVTDRWAAYQKALARIKSGESPSYCSPESSIDEPITELQCVECGDVLTGPVCPRCCP